MSDHGEKGDQNDAGSRVLKPEPPVSSTAASPAPPRRTGASVETRKARRRSRLRSYLVRAVEIFVVSAGLLFTAVIAAAVTFTLAVRGNEVIVPDLIGSSLEGAGQSLTSEQLKLWPQGNRFDGTVPPDFIAAQDPPAGTKLKKGRSVRVWLSLGPERRTVPRVEGESLQSAQLILEQAGFTLGRIVEIHSIVYAPDTVVAQSPQAYEEAGDDTEVSVLLSRGYIDDAYVMPDFIGRNYADLLDSLGRSTIRVSAVRMVDYPGVPKNVIVRQTPSPGTKVYKRDRVVLYLSKGS